MKSRRNEFTDSKSHLVYEFTEVIRVIDDFIYFPAWWMPMNSVNKWIHMIINYLNSCITLGQTFNEFTVEKNSYDHGITEFTGYN